jgi:ABC-type Fe3+ transport system substrate-binding protein
MRRYGWIVLFVVVLVTPIVLRWGMGKPAVAVGEGELRLVIISAHNEGIRREFGEAFSRWHQEKYGKPVYMDFRSYGGGSEIVKYFQASKSVYETQGTYKIDLVWGGGDYLFETQLKRPGFLQGVRLDPGVMKEAFPRPKLGGVALYDQSDPPQWFGTALASFGIVYNKDVVRYLGVKEPTTWSDLTDPRWRGWIALADPTRSASARMAFMIIAERAMADAAERGESEDSGWARGMGMVRQIASNARLFTDSAELVPSLVSSGDCGAGMAIDFYGRSQVDAVGEQRMGYVEPAHATAINPDPIALVKGAEHRELAIRFIEFVLSERGQKLWNTRAGLPGGPATTSLRRLPIAPGIYAHPEVMSDPVNPYTSSGGFNKSDAREKTFGMLGEWVQMSCMELLDELQETRKVILASSRAKELDAKLGVFPFDQKEALRRAGVWRKASAAERLRLQRQWTGEFREEYRKLREQAKVTMGNTVNTEGKAGFSALSR